MTADFLDTGFPPLLSFEVSAQLKSPPITIVSFEKSNLLGDIVRCVNVDENNYFLFQ